MNDEVLLQLKETAKLLERFIHDVSLPTDLWLNASALRSMIHVFCFELEKFDAANNL